VSGARRTVALRQVSISEAFKRKYPEQIALAVSVDEAGRADVITLGWVMPTSNEPPMVAISVGHTRHSHELIGKSGEFILVFPSVAQAEACLICGTRSGRDTDKIAAEVLAAHVDDDAGERVYNFAGKFVAAAPRK
jgi:flavin reductase (DIM6/NTAB) family NADH-FMN oxidoreductase RutF